MALSENWVRILAGVLDVLLEVGIPGDWVGVLDVGRLV